jgi:hypothetical protein
MAADARRARPGFFARLLGTMAENVAENLMGGPPPDPGRNPAREDDLIGRRGNDALFHEAEHLGRRADFAMQNVGYWTQLAGHLIIQATNLAVGVAARGMTNADGSATANQVSKEVDAASRNLANSPGANRGAPSTAQTLMKMRDEAVRITEKLESQDGPFNPLVKGDVVGAIAKALARDGIDKGILPATLKIGPPSSSLLGLPVPQSPVLDFWEPDGTGGGVGYDITTATVRQVAGHDLRYIWNTRNPLVMPDGTKIRDVFPLVYPPRGRPWLGLSPLNKTANPFGLPPLRPGPKFFGVAPSASNARD